MKYVLVLGDGMADEPIASIGNKTPLEVAKKPVIDDLAAKGIVGLVDTIPPGMSPGSDVANLSVLGYDSSLCYTGRSPLEAISMGIEMKDTDICMRCNLVTLSEDEAYENKRILDHSADEITTEEAKELLLAIQEAFNSETFQFYPGVSYRHAMIWEAGSLDVTLIPPHNILDKVIANYLPQGESREVFTEMMKQSFEILNQHPINVKRAEKGLNKANSIWLWGEGTRPSLTSFEEKYGKKGAVISAVDLLKGIAISAKMKSIDVVGATGGLHTNYAGKVKACLDALESGSDFVYVHIEAPDECGHRGELDNKILSIEYLDQKVVKPILEGLEEKNYAYRIIVLPDHPTPIAYRTHTSDPVPFLIYDSTHPKHSGSHYSEAQGKASGIFVEKGYTLLQSFFEGSVG